MAYGLKACSCHPLSASFITPISLMWWCLENCIYIKNKTKNRTNKQIDGHNKQTKQTKSQTRTKHIEASKELKLKIMKHCIKETKIHKWNGGHNA